MKAYEFDREPPYLYLGAIEATPDPFEADVWRAPAFSVFEQPPEPLQGHAVVRVGFDRPDGEWQQIEDHRGQTGYTAWGAAVEVTAVGPLALPIITLTAPPGEHYNWVDGAWVPDIEAMVAAKLRDIDTARDEAIAGGFLYNGTRFDSDAKSIQRISGAVTLSMLNPAYETDWITFDNGTVTLDATGLAGLGAAAGIHEAEQIFKARSLKNQALAATTPEEIAAISW